MTVPVVAATQASLSSANTTSMSVTKVADTASGELGIIILAAAIDDIQSDTFNTPSGWTKIGTGIPTSASYDVCCVAYWRELTGDSGDDAPTVSWTGNAHAMATYSRITGADTTTPLDVVGSEGQQWGGVLAIPEVTTTVDDCLAFYLQGFDGGDGSPFTVSGTGWTEEYDDQWSTAGSTVSMSWGTKDQASAGLTGDASVDFNSGADDGNVGFQFAIAPEAAGGSTLPIFHRHYQLIKS